MPIRQLPESVVAQIAAGEVIERPTSVVKELLENAIDGGARSIHIAISGDGRRLIQIADDGHGILSDEVELAFLRHATSKLTDADDLYRIRTLGFRGEALASVASVSQVQMSTRHASETMGTWMQLEGGQIVGRRAAGIPSGTTIRVENLFFNTPARLKFLKAETTEKRQIASVVSRYAMAYSHIRFVLEQDGREAFRAGGSGSLADVLVNIVGLDTFKNMLEVDATTDDYQGIRVYGFTSTPSLHRADRSRITLFINGRWIQDTGLTHAVVQAYHTLLMTGRYPIAMLMIDLPPEQVDVNVHPTKAEVRFQHHETVFSAVQRAVRRSLIEHARVPSFRTARPHATDTNTREWDRRRGVQMDMEIGLNDPGQPAVRQHDSASGEADDPTAIPEGLGAPARPRTLPLLRLVGQIAASYIIAEGPAGLYLIDQHAAHERVLYEQFLAEYERQQTVTQYALEAQTLHVSPGEARLIEAHLEVLASLGFGLETFGPNLFIVRSVPGMLADGDPVEVMTAILDDLEAGEPPGRKAIEDKIILRVCKTAAVKAGQVLSLEQMQTLIRQLERCSSPLTCPHGRPTLIHISSDQLAREFGRLGAG
ncbi:MAG: DNA mismatch repair endonuclease MutL [bacterium]|nr:DNA mismatch repair endonuclease MutL [bacterium]